MVGEAAMNSEELAWKIRRDAINMVQHAHSSHIGGILSVADIIAVLYSDVLRVNPSDPEDECRDRFVMSKGHCGVAVYAALAEKGFFPVDELKTYGDDGGMFSCHISHKVPGVEVTTGSLGHGICMACGMALHAKLKHKDYKVYAVVGDGECNEGSVWETAMFASQYKLDNFTVIVDRNGMQAMGFCKDVIDMEPLVAKWESFGWKTVNVKDGNNHDQLRAAFAVQYDGHPRVIIANTIKGKGISYMENKLLWHYHDPQGKEYEKAIKELEDSRP